MPLSRLDMVKITGSKSNKARRGISYSYKKLVASLDNKDKLSRNIDRCNALLAEYTRLRSRRLTESRANKMVDILDRLLIESKLACNRILSLKRATEKMSYIEVHGKPKEITPYLELYNGAISEIRRCCDFPLILQERDKLYFDIYQKLGSEALTTHEYHLINAQKDARKPISVMEFVTSKKASPDTEVFKKLKSLDDELTISEKLLRKHSKDKKSVNAVINKRQSIISECKRLLSVPEINMRYCKELWRVIHNQSNHISNMVNSHSDLLKEEIQNTRELESVVAFVAERLLELQRKINNKEPGYALEEIQASMWADVLQEQFTPLTVSFLGGLTTPQFQVYDPDSDQSILVRKHLLPQNMQGGEVTYTFIDALQIAQENGLSRYFGATYSYLNIGVFNKNILCFEIAELLPTDLSQTMVSLNKAEENATLRVQYAMRYGQKLLEMMDRLNKYELFFSDIRPSNFMLDKDGQLKISDKNTLFVRRDHENLDSRISEVSPQYKNNQSFTHDHHARLDNLQKIALGVSLYEMATCRDQDVSWIERIGTRWDDPFMFDFRREEFEDDSGKILKYLIMKMTDPDNRLQSHIEYMKLIRDEHKTIEQMVIANGLQDDLRFNEKLKIMIEDIYCLDRKNIQFEDKAISRNQFIEEFRNEYGEYMLSPLLQLAEYMQLHDSGYQSIINFMQRLDAYEVSYGCEYLNDVLSDIEQMKRYFTSHKGESLSDLSRILSSNIVTSSNKLSTLKANNSEQWTQEKDLSFLNKQAMAVGKLMREKSEPTGMPSKGSTKRTRKHLHGLSEENLLESKVDFEQKKSKQRRMKISNRRGRPKSSDE